MDSVSDASAGNSMELSLDAENVRAESQPVSIEECRQLCEVPGGVPPEENLVQLGTQTAAEDSMERQLDDGRTAESVRSSLSNFRQSASRTTGQIRELLETSKALDHDLVVFLQDPQTRAFLERVEDDDDDDNNLMDIGDDASSDNPKEIEALKQKTKSLKRKLRKWRKAARMALSEICPDINADAQGDMTPGTMKNVLQKIRQLKNLTDQQMSIISTLKSQCEAQKFESDEKDALIMELLRNCNGIRPVLVKGEQQAERMTGSGASSLEGMVIKKETIDYPLISASEVEDVLTQTSIQFGSAHLIPKQIHHEERPETEGGTRPENAAVSDAPAAMDVVATENSDAEAIAAGENVSYTIHPRAMHGLRPNGTLNKAGGKVWWAVAVGTTAGIGRLIMGNLSRRQNNN